jgi:hypothetical protein
VFAGISFIHRMLNTSTRIKGLEMSPLVKNVLAVIAGLIVGSVVNMAIVSIDPLVIPLPEGVDMSNMDQLADNIKRLSAANFFAPWLGHAMGTLVGAFVAAKVAASHKMRFALVIAAFFLVGGIMMVAMIGGPIWFVALDLIGAYLPMGYLGGMLGRGRPAQS